jgi:hypothetical protein
VRAQLQAGGGVQTHMAAVAKDGSEKAQSIGRTEPFLSCSSGGWSSSLSSDSSTVSRLDTRIVC